MSAMSARFVLPLVALALGACAKEAPERVQPDVAKTAPATVQKNLALGAPIPANAKTVALADVAKNPSAYDGKSITTTGTVTAVCQAMGCWMEIKDDASQAHIKMAGHGFFVPKTAAGHKAKVMATLSSEADGCNEADCSRKDGKDGELAKLQLVATGVELD